jgi:hypothetical protein
VTAVKELSARKVSVFWRTHTQRVDVVAQVAERAGAAVAEGVAVGVGEAGHNGGSGALLDGGGAGGAHRVDVAEAVGADGGVPVGVVDRTQPPGGVRGRGDTAGDRLLYGFDSLASVNAVIVCRVACPAGGAAAAAVPWRAGTQSRTSSSGPTRASSVLTGLFNSSSGLAGPLGRSL